MLKILKFYWKSFLKRIYSFDSNLNKKEDGRTEKRKVGDLGEKIACEWLEEREFSIILRNYSKKWGEIDIIAQKFKKVHFIEVKSVTRESLDDFSPGNDSFRPEDNIHPWKLKRISRTIQSYILENKMGEDKDWQFDAMTVYLDVDKKQARVECLQDLIL